MNDEHPITPGFVSGAQAPVVSGAAEVSAASSNDRETHPFAVADAERYAVRARLGEGGMGRVELALDRRLLREVALKVPRRGADASVIDSGDSATRLAQEAWITAQLDHPGIVPIYDAGRAPDGTLFYTMRVIRGRSLEEELAHCPDLAARLRYVRHFLTACEAIAYAHQLGIVHRDIKPQNILVGELGETQVADWGVARPTASTTGAAWADAVIPEGHAAVTMLGGVVGTPAYMSPEQSLGAEVDPRADVWSLGAVLYRLLAGRPPFDGATASEVLAQVRASSPRPLDNDVPRELRAITMSALAHDASARYPTARELARDIASWLDGRRVSAHSYSTIELLRRLLRAWRVPLIVAAIAFVLLIVGTIVAVDRVVGERDRAVLAESATTRALAGSLVIRAVDEAQRGQWPEAEDLAARALTLSLAQVGEAATASPDHLDTTRARGVLMAADRPRPRRESATALACAVSATAPDGRTFVCVGASVTGWRVGDTAPRWTRPLDARFVAFADAATVVVADRDHHVHRLAIADGSAITPPVALERVHGLAAGQSFALVHVGWSVQAIDPHGTALPLTRVCAVPRAVRLVLIGAGPRFVVGCDDGNLASSSDGADWTPIPTTLGPDAIGLVGALSADGARLAIINDKGGLALVAWPSGEVLSRRDTGIRGARALALSGDGRRLAVTSLHGATRVLDAASGHELTRLPRGGEWLDWNGDSEVLVTWGDGGRERWQLPATFVAHVVGDEGPSSQGGIAAAAIADDGRVAVGRGAGQVDVYTASGQLQRHAQLGEQTVKSLSFSPDGTRLYVAAIDGGIRVLDAGSLDANGVIGTAPHRRVAALADGTLLVAQWRAGPAVYAASGALLVGQDADAPAVSDLDVAADRTWAVLLEEATSRVLTFDGKAFTPLLTMPGAVAVAAGRDEVAVVSRDAVRVVGRDGNERTTFAIEGVGLDVALSPEQRFIAVAHLDRADILDREGVVVATLPGHDERVAQLVSTSEALYTVSWDGTVRRWSWAALTRDASDLARDAQRWGLSSDVLAPDR